MRLKSPVLFRPRPRWTAIVLFLAFSTMGASTGLSPGGQKYADHVRSAAEKHGLDEELIHSIIEAESNYDPAAVSSKGAVGLMQLIPETAARYGVSDATDPAQNIEAGAHYLKDLFKIYQDDLHSVLAAYNAGPEAVKKHNGIPPYPETKRYIRRVLGIYARLGGTVSGRIYKFQDDQGRVLLTSDRFYMSMKRGS